MKKALALLLAMIMIISLLPAQVLAADSGSETETTVTGDETVTTDTPVEDAGACTHTPGEVVETESVTATADANGYYILTTYCADCGEVMGTERIETTLNPDTVKFTYASNYGGLSSAGTSISRGATKYYKTNDSKNLITGTADDWSVKFEYPADRPAVLTLKDADFTGVGLIYGNHFTSYKSTNTITCEVPLNIVLEGANTITTNHQNVGALDLYTLGDVTISGTGSLQIYNNRASAGAGAIHVGGNLILDNTNLSVTCPDDYYYSDGIVSETGDITVNGGTLNITSIDDSSATNFGGTTDNNETIRTGINVMAGDLNITNGAKVNLQIHAYTIVLGVSGNVNITNSDVDIKAQRSAIFSANNLVLSYANGGEVATSTSGCNHSAGALVTTGTVTNTTVAAFDASNITSLKYFKVTHGCVVGDAYTLEAPEHACSTTQTKVGKCKFCGENASETVAVANPAAHTAGEAVETETVRATADAAGYYVLTTYCADCGEAISTETVETTYNTAASIAFTYAIDYANLSSKTISRGSTVYLKQDASNKPAAGSASDWTIKLEYPVDRPATLTLKGANLSGAVGLIFGEYHSKDATDNGKTVTCNVPLNIVLEGENYIYASHANLGALDLYTTGDITISGDGSLFLKSNRNSATAGALNTYGNLTLDNADVKIELVDTVNNKSYVVATHGKDLTVDGGKLYIDAYDDPSASNNYEAARGLFGANNVTIKNGANVKAGVTLCTDNDIGMNVTGDFIINNSDVEIGFYRVKSGTQKTFVKAPVLQFAGEYEFAASVTNRQAFFSTADFTFNPASPIDYAAYQAADITTVSYLKTVHACVKSAEYELLDPEYPCASVQDKKYTCTICGADVIEEGPIEVEQAPHTGGTLEEIESVTATAEANGYYKLAKTCEVCGEHYDVQTVETTLNPSSVVLTYGRTMGELTSRSVSRGNTVYYMVSASGPYLVSGTSDSWNVKFEFPADRTPTMTLKNLNIESAFGLIYGNYKYSNEVAADAVTCTLPLNIVLEGENYITTTHRYAGGLDLYTKGDVTISGTGSLYITNNRGDSKICGAINTYGNLTVKDAAVTVNCVEDPYLATAIATQNGNVTIDGGTVNIISVNTSANTGTNTLYKGIYVANGDLNVINKAKLNVNANIYSGGPVLAVSGNINITDSDVEIIANGQYVFNSSATVNLSYTTGATVITSTSNCPRKEDETGYEAPAAQYLKTYTDETFSSVASLFYFKATHNCVKAEDDAGVVTAPTCTEGGYTTYTCTFCGETFTADETEAAGHIEETIPGKAPTCTETGLTDGSVCTVCGETIKAQEEIPVSTHTEEIIPGKAPTCTETGLTDGIVCTVCGEIVKAQEEIPATGHTEETVAGKAPTCTETGLTDGIVCSVCGETIKAQEEIPATGHTEETVAGKAPTCTETGLTDGIVCTVCGEIVKAQEEIPATGHTEETVAGKAPTCTETGLTDGMVCTVCGEIVKAQEEIPATGHTEETVAGKAPTCTETGLTDGIVCTVCGEIVKAQEEIEATGHGDYTYTNNGENHTIACGKCDYTATEDHTFVDGTCICTATEGPVMDANLAIKNTSAGLPATLMLGADLKLSFNVPVKTTNTYERVFLRITKLGATTDVEAYSTSSSSRNYRYTLAAPEMTAEMTVVVCGEKDGKIYAGTPITFTYKEIVVARMDAFYAAYETTPTDTASLNGCIMLANLLKYGEEAQKRFNISTDNLATAGLSDTYLAMINSETPTLDTWVAPTKSTYYLGSYTPMLQEQIKIALTFVVPTYESLEGYEVKIVQTKSTGVVTHTFGADVLKSSSTTRIRCDFAIAGAEGRDQLEITLYKDGAAVSETVITNLGALAQGKQSDTLNPLLYAMMNYCDAAKAFFG